MTVSIMPSSLLLVRAVSGAILSSMDGKSASRPGSYAIVVRAAVDPGYKQECDTILDGSILNNDFVPYL
jgi:hypothetical protein